MSAEYGDPDFNDMIGKLAESGIDQSIAEANSLHGAAIAANELFQSYLQVGFTPPQSLYLTGVAMTGNPGIPPRN